jgi:hypothetical protein
VARGACPILLGVGALAAYNQVRFGSVADFGYESGASGGLDFFYAEAARDFLVDPRKSILLFAPAAVLIVPALASLWRSKRTIAILLAGNLVATLVVVGAWPGWSGGTAWGPRYLILGVIPALVAVTPWLTTRVRMVAAATLFAVGFAVSAATLVVSTQAQQLDGSKRPGVLRQIELVPRTIRYTRTHLYEASERATGEHRRYVTLWQVGLARELGRGGLLLGALGTLALLAIAIVASRSLNAALEPYPSEP